MNALFSRNSGGYRRLNDFALATVIQLETWRFCERFLTLKNDPKGRLMDQMTQAARSGRANLMEGAEDNATSREGEMKLTGVAKASFAELLGDFEMWLLYNRQVPWTLAEARPVFDIRLDNAVFGESLLHDSASYYLQQRQKFALWLDSADSCVVANCLLVLLHRTIVMIQKQLQHLGEEFAQNGGLREQMTAVRLEARDRQRGLPPAIPAQDPTAPLCPKCGIPMRKRVAKDGGKAFWGCANFPNCRETLPM